MKKAIWISAIVMVVALISTVCFGAALGSQGVREVLRDDGILDNWSQTVSDWHNIVKHGEYLFDEIHEEEFLFDSKTLELPVSDILKITAEVGSVRIVRGTGDTVHAVLEQFSVRTNPTSRFTLSKDGDTELRLSAESALNGVSARLTVYVPSALSDLSVEVETGEIEVEDVTADIITANVATGNIEMKRVTAKNAQVRVDTGNADIDGSVRVSETMTVHCACGEVEFEMPVGGAKLVQYSVDTGNVETSGNITGWKRNSTKNGVSREGTFTYIQQDKAANGTYQIDVSLGNIEFDAESD